MALLQLLNEQGNAASLPGGIGVAASYNTALKPDAAGIYRVEVTWEPEAAERGNLVRSEIRVLYGDAGQEIYRLHTAAYKESGR